MDWQKIWDQIVTFFQTNGWHLATFFGVLIGGILGIKIALNILRHILNRTAMEKIAVGFVMAILKFLAYLFLIITLLRIIGVEITGLVTAFSAVFLSVGLALQNNISNLANGIIIVSSKMFKKGDYISVDGVEGSVVQINFLYVTIVTYDNKRITLPNNKILNEVVINFESNYTRRVNYEFRVDFAADLDKVKQIVIDSMKSNGLVRLDPAPFCRLTRIEPSGLVLAARCWCDCEDYWTVYFDVMETVFNEFRRHNIYVPSEQIEIRQRKDKLIGPASGKGLPERHEKIRKIRHHFDLENDDFGTMIKNHRQNQVTRKQLREQRAARKAAKKAAKAAAKAAKKEQAAAQQPEVKPAAPVKPAPVKHAPASSKSKKH